MAKKDLPGAVELPVAPLASGIEQGLRTKSAPAAAARRFSMISQGVSKSLRLMAAKSCPRGAPRTRRARSPSEPDTPAKHHGNLGAPVRRHLLANISRTRLAMA